MSRTIALVLASILGAAFFLGCGSSGNNGSDGGSGGNGSDGPDMSAPFAGGNDLAMTLPPDMQPAYGCHALAACIDACTDQASCGLCIASATPKARGLYQTVTRCVRNECFPHPDAGAAPCTFGGGTPSAACNQCQADSIKMSGTCGAGSMYCGTCYTSYSACEADTP